MEMIEDDSLEFARRLKRKLRFDIGEIVYLKSDLNKKCPMTVSAFEVINTDYDYILTWITSQKQMETTTCLDKVLMQ